MPRHVMAYTVRRARRTDAQAWVALIEELATFEKLAPPTLAARRRLVRDAFGRSPRIEVLVGLQGRLVVAYAIIAWTYSSFLAKPTLWLEDLYIQPAHRGTGLAKMMLDALATRALRENAGRIEGIVLDWNERAQRFYERTGARLMREWILLRYDESALRRVRPAGRSRGRLRHR